MYGPAHSDPRFLPSVRTCDQNSLIPSSHYNGNSHHHQHHHQSFKWPRISETTSKRREVPYKSQVCLKFQRGNCNYGEHCRFAHAIGDLQFRRGFVPPNPVQHDENPIKVLRICWRYSRYGECPYGDGCHFIHQEGVGLGRTSVAINIVNGAGTACPGGDPSSDRSGFNADDKLRGYEKPAGWRTRMCIKWRTTGSCPYGLRCSFAHGESELQKRVWGKASECLSTSKQKALSKQWVFKWNDVEKISRIYADWIPNTLLVDDSSGTVGS